MITQQNQLVTDLSSSKQKPPCTIQKQVKIKTPLEVLKETSRTFYIPIIKLPGQCQDAVASAYLCLRAIDEIEDHPTLPNDAKVKILRQCSNQLQKIKANSTKEDLTPKIFQEYATTLPEVSLRLGEWIKYAPQNFQARIADTTSCMADRMAYWADVNWKIEEESDLDHYCFSVAGAVGLILCEIWEWYEGTKTDRELAIGYGRGLQSVNILRNQVEDQTRGVSFLPPGWGSKELITYCRKNLEMAKKYQESLPKTSAALVFCKIPYALAKATLECIAFGKEKLSRQEVVQIIDQIDEEQKDQQTQNKENVLNINNNTTKSENIQEISQQQE